MVTGRCSEEIPVNHQLGSHQKMLHSSATSIVSFDLLYQQEQVKRNSVACSASRSPAWPFNGDLHFTLDHSKVYCLTAFSLIAGTSPRGLEEKDRELNFTGRQSRRMRKLKVLRVLSTRSGTLSCRNALSIVRSFSNFERPKTSR